MQQVTMQTLAAFIDAARELNHPLLIWGSPGLGKSQAVAQAAERVGGVVVDVRLSLYESVDLRGLMDFADDLTVWKPPATLPFKGNTSFPDDVPIILFLDELLHAAPSVLAVAFQLVLDRRIGEHLLKANVRIVAASNRSQDRSGVGKLPTALANRFDHVEVIPDVRAWKTWAYAHGVDEAVIAYLSARPESLDQFASALKTGDKSFPTPRAWAKLSQKMSLFEASPHFAGMATACIGEAMATEFVAFVRNRERLIPFADILKNPQKCRVPQDGDVDVLYCLSALLVNRIDKENIEKVMIYTQRLPLEYQVLVLKDVFDAKPAVGLSSPTALKLIRMLDSAVYG